MSRRVVALALVLASLSVTSSARAQYHNRYASRSSEQSVSYSLGFAALDDGYSTDSLGRAWSVRMTAPILGRFVLGELGVGGISEKDYDGVRQRFVIPEAQLQVQLPVGPFRPYVGFGAGGVFGPTASTTILAGGARTVSTALGLRTYLSGDRLTLNLESRVRQYMREGYANTSSVDVTAGFGVRF